MNPALSMGSPYADSGLADRTGDPCAGDLLGQDRAGVLSSAMTKAPPGTAAKRTGRGPVVGGRARSAALPGEADLTKRRTVGREVGEPIENADVAPQHAGLAVAVDLQDE